MENNILRFKKLYEENIVNNELNERLLNDDTRPVNYLATTYSFELGAKYNSGCFVIGSYTEALITLDEEDMNYLTTKYFCKLDLELQDKINKLKNEYSGK